MLTTRQQYLHNLHYPRPMARDHSLELESRHSTVSAGNAKWVPLAAGVVLLIGGVIVGLGTAFYCEHSSCTTGKDTPEAVCHERLDVRRGRALIAPPEEELRRCVQAELNTDRFLRLAVPAGLGLVAFAVGAFSTLTIHARELPTHTFG